MTSQKQILLFTEEELTSLPEGSPVNPTHLPVNDLAKKMTDTSGRKCCEQLKKFNHVGLWAKMFTDLLIGQEGWFSTKCKLTWKLKGTKYSRMYCQLAPSTLPTDEIEYGLLLKTPCTADAYTEGMSKKEQKFGNSGTLAQEIQTGFVYQRGMLPTPQASDFVGTVQQNNYSLRHLEHGTGWAQMLPTPTARDEKNGSNITDNRMQRKIQQGWTIDLNDMARCGMLPTPTAQDGGKATKKMRENHQNNLTAVVFHGMLPTPATRDWKGARTEEALEEAGRNHTNSLPDAFAQTGTTSQLNPRFVLEMMGFPPNWTELPFLNGETNQ